MLALLLKDSRLVKIPGISSAMLRSARTLSIPGLDAGLVLICYDEIGETVTTLRADEVLLFGWTADEISMMEKLSATLSARREQDPVFLRPRTSAVLSAGSYQFLEELRVI